jgi:outer membrane lipoprotein-sorting protein
MKYLFRLGLLAGVGAAACFAQSSDELLARLDRLSKTFKGMKAEIRVTNHIAGLPKEEIDSGSILIRRDSPAKVRMLISFTGANASTVLLSGQTAEIYHPKLNEVQEYDIRKYKDVAQQLFQLGFGVAGADLAKSYEITLLKREAVSGENATFVEVAPKSAQVRKLLSKMELWISDKTNCAVRHKLYFPDGGYRVAEYSDMLVNPNIPASSFDLPKGATRVKVN